MPTLSSSRGVAAETRAGIVAALASRPAEMTGRARYAIRTYAVGTVAHPLLTSLEGVADLDHQRYSARVVLFNPTDGSSTPPMEFLVVADQIHERVPQGWMTGTKRPSEMGLRCPCLRSSATSTRAAWPPTPTIPLLVGSWSKGW